MSKLRGAWSDNGSKYFLFILAFFLVAVALKQLDVF